MAAHADVPRPEAVRDRKGNSQENLRTDRLSLLVDQLDRARERAQVRLTGLGDEEYLWEPAPGAWSIRRRDELTPVTTIAWRLGHLQFGFAGRWEWTFGERRRQPDLLVDFTPSASLAMERFWVEVDRWHDSVAAMTPEQLDTPGFGQYPDGSDPDEPFATVLVDQNLEFIHHMAEIALLRDLWRARSASGG